MLADTFHYPPDLFNLLIETVPLLNKSKRDVLTFFQGAGVPDTILSEFWTLLDREPDQFKKHPSTRKILTRINRDDDTYLQQRREVLKRICEYENFSMCWPEDRETAKLRVSEVREMIGIKDSFTRMTQEKDRERQARVKVSEAIANKTVERQQELDRVKRDLFSLFSLKDAHARGKALEGVLNRLFSSAGLLVREDFTVTQEEGVVVEQIDGAIEMDGNLYIVEMKWHTKNLGPDITAQHLVRTFARGDVRGMIISNSGFTPGAIDQVREALRERVFILIDLSEIVELLEKSIPLAKFLNLKSNAAQTDKNPYHHPIGISL